MVIIGELGIVSYNDWSIVNDIICLDFIGGSIIYLIYLAAVNNIKNCIAAKPFIKISYYKIFIEAGN